MTDAAPGFTLTVSGTYDANGSVSVPYTGTLRQADAVTGPYTDMAGTSPLTPAPASGARKFYRAYR